MLNPFGLSVRRATKDDYLFIKKLVYDELWVPVISRFALFEEEWFEKDFNRSYRSIHVLLKGKKPVGIYQLEPRGKSLYLKRLFLVPKFQGKGFGSFFLNYIESLGYGRIAFHVWEGNRALNLYRRNGYRVRYRLKKRPQFYLEKQL